MQPLLLLKQTLEATYDPGPLLLNGPNVKFTSAEQLLTRTGQAKPADAFHIGVWLGGDAFVTHFRPQAHQGFDIQQRCRDFLKEVRNVVWVNPAQAEEQPIPWLEKGAPAERNRQLGAWTGEA